MKKILVVLLTLAVAGGVFAQEGSWSLGAGALIGTRITIDGWTGYGTIDASNQDPVAINASMYQRPYQQWNATRGSLATNYSRGPLALGIDWMIRPDGNVLFATLSGSGDSYKFVAGSNLLRWLGTNAPDAGDPRIHRLWGEYNMLNEMLTLVVAYKSDDTQYWYSDTSAGLIDDSVANTGNSFGWTENNGIFGWNGNAKLYNNVGIATGVYRGVYLFGEGNGVSGNGKTFTRVDGNNYLLADFGFSGLNFGIMLPNTFSDAYMSGSELQPHEGQTRSAKLDLVGDVLRNAVFGAKFSMYPIEFAAQFRVYDYGIYFGGKFFLGPVTIGASFMGQLNDPDNARKMKVGGSVNYSQGAFGAGILAWYHNDRPDVAVANYKSIIGFEPYFFFNVIPTHLRFELNAGFYFNTVKIGTDYDDMRIFWALQPQLFWNFRGTGAGSYWGVGTGIIARYRVVSEATNALDIVFKFSL
jgi:hypothetical protein